MDEANYHKLGLLTKRVDQYVTRAPVIHRCWMKTFPQNMALDKSALYMWDGGRGQGGWGTRGFGSFILNAWWLKENTQCFHEGTQQARDEQCVMVDKGIEERLGFIESGCTGGLTGSEVKCWGNLGLGWGAELQFFISYIPKWKHKLVWVISYELQKKAPPSGHLTWVCIGHFKCGFASPISCQIKFFIFMQQRYGRPFAFFVWDIFLERS